MRLDSPDWKWLQHPWLANLFLTALFIVISFGLGFQLYDNWLLVSLNKKDVSIQQEAIVEPEMASAETLKLSPTLFGQYTEATTVTPAPAVLPATTVSINLQAIFYAKDAALSAVSIASDRKTELYRVRDELMPGVVIDRIDRDRVTLQRNGQLEVLVFDQQSSRSGVTLSAPKKPTGLAQTAVPSARSGQPSLEEQLQALRNQLRPPG